MYGMYFTSLLVYSLKYLNVYLGAFTYVAFRLLESNPAAFHQDHLSKEFSTVSVGFWKWDLIAPRKSFDPKST